MTYVGQQPATTFDAGIQDRFTGLTTNTVTLNHEISAEEDILVVWNNIVQDKNTYSVGGTGNKTLTLGGTLVSADVVTVYYLNKVMQSVNPTAGSVNTDQLATNAVTNAKMADDAIGVAELSATGTASSSTFLRGDNSWAAAGGANTPAFSAKLTSDLSMASATTVYDVVFGTEYFDVGSCYDHSTGVFTVPSGEAGKYYFHTSCMFIDANGNVSDMLLYLHSTISSSASQDLVARANSTSDGTLFTHKELAFNTILSLGVGDQIKIQAYQQTNNASAITLKSGTGTVFSAFKLIE